MAMATVSDHRNRSDDPANGDEITQDEIDEFLAASSDSEDEQNSAPVLGDAVGMDSVDGDIGVLNQPTSEAPMVRGKDEISQEDMDAFLADLSDTECDVGVGEGLPDVIPTKAESTVVKNDEINQDEIDDFLADCSDTDDDVPVMNILSNSQKVNKVEETENSYDEDLGASRKHEVEKSDGANVEHEETLEEKVKRMEAEMMRMRQQLQEQKEKEQQKSPGSILKKKVQFENKIREADEDLFSAESTSKSKPCHSGDRARSKSPKAMGSSSKSPKASVSPGTSKQAQASGSRRRLGKAVSQDDASKIVGPLTFYKKEESKPANDSGSDWEDMDGDKPYLSKQGQDIKKLITSKDHGRIAHVPKCDNSEFNKKRESWMKTGSGASKAPSVCKPRENGRVQVPTKKEKEFEDCDFMKERYSGIRIVNPLVSHATMSARMDSRKMIKMSSLGVTSKNYLNDANWVTIGVVISKSDTRKSSKGKNYVIWRLSDLEDCDKVVSLFLFGESYSQLWKENVGSVIGILNASLMAPSEKQNSSKNEVCLTIDHPQKVMLMGRSKDLGRCKARTKAGNPCINVVNKRLGEYCSYHVQAAYKKTSAKRSELQAGYNAPVPKSFDKVFKPGQEVFYGGQSFSSESFKRQKKQDKVTLKSIEKHKVSTMSIQELQPEDKEKLQELVNTKKEAFQDMLSRPTVGSMNLVRHLHSAEKAEQEKKTKDKTIVSVSFKDFLKTTKQELECRRKGLKPSAMGISPSNSQKSEMTPVPSTSGPQLGRGFRPGADIVFDLDSPKPSWKVEENSERSSLPSLPNKKSISKEQAAAKLKGAIRQTDPNNIKKKVSPDVQRRIKKRLLENSDAEKENPSSSSPPNKKPKILGGVDIDSEEVQKLLRAGSSHKGAVSELEAEAHEKYFTALESKEKLEDKMASITRVLCAVVSCKVCNYTAEKPSELCKSKGHQLARNKAYKRFFKCVSCNERCIAYDKYPHHDCKKCGGSSFMATTMLKERTGVKLESEKLLLRGEEQPKFLNSLG